MLHFGHFNLRQGDFSHSLKISICPLERLCKTSQVEEEFTHVVPLRPQIPGSTSSSDRRDTYRYRGFFFCMIALRI
jgi:hypothetical protein